MIMGIAASSESNGLHIMFNDVKKAYCHAKSARELYVDIPNEDPEWTPDVVGRLRLALYDTRDAATLWQECVAVHLLSIGIRQGKSNPCVYYNKARRFGTLVHGDVCASVGSLVNLRWLKGQLDATFEMKSVICGHSDESDVVREAKILNSIIRTAPEGREYECAQRHAEIMIEALGLEGTKKVGTPSAKGSTKDGH